MPLRIALRCDAGPAIGAGHAMRSLALGEALVARGHAVQLLADTRDLGWVAEAYARRGIAVAPPPADAQLVDAVAGRFDAVVVDSYTLPADVYDALRRAVALTVALVDTDRRGASADLLVDQNLGAERDPIDLPAATRRLAGAPFALIRAEIAAARPAAPPSAAAGRPRVLVVLGGTDALGLAPRLTAAVLATRRPLDVAVVAARGDLRVAVGALDRAPEQRVVVHAPLPDLHRLVLDSDLVVGATGSATWEFLTLGACVAAVCVADNQRTNYGRLVEAGVITGLGDPGTDPAEVTRRLDALLAHPSRRTDQARAGWALIDGRGADRVAEAMERASGAPADRVVR